MAPYLLVLLVVAQSPFPLVAGSAPILSKNCGDDRVVYSELGLDFFVDQTKVEGIAPICKLLELGFSNGCFSGDRGGEEWGRIVETYCGRRFFATARAEHDAVSGNLLRRTGRKLLLQLPESVSTFDALGRSNNSHDKKEPHNFWLVPDHVSVAAPGFLLLCCTLLCPCFRAKRKEVIDHTILAKNLGSMDSSSSFEVSSTSERIPQSPFRVPPSPSRFSKPPQITKIGSLDVSVDQIIKATRNFSLSLKVGEGGFGTVYKGMLPDGEIVAIKRAKKEHFASLRVEFRNEVELLTKIDHRNLVRLLGYIDKGNEHIIITEYVPNGTLRDHLDGQYGRILDFNRRLEIAIDVAHGLTYLHLYAEKPIIHRDVKSSNILLMENFRAKVADFGFARTGPTEAEQTHIVTQVKGTVGYLDPEYTRTNQLTPKSDVYSFGILLIEILSARRPVDLKRPANERITVRWAFGLYNGGNVREILDPLLEEVVAETVVKKMLDLAFQCAAPTRSDRPDMKEVVEQLWSIRRDHGRSLKRIAKQ